MKYKNKVICIVAVSVAVVVAMFAIFTMVDCHRSISGEDRDRLQILSNKFPLFNFEFDCDLYLAARQVDDGPVPDDAVIQEMYTAFFLEKDSDKKRDTSFVYLNVYNLKGRFQFQVYGVTRGTVAKEYKRVHY